ncbi:hypothetical protein MiSe_77210 [Microseira wollei NIES-4236]|uniref:Uncharacterized protein n=1 Tax=Microseira wollei NIES-4236 TaxID=2530354 RepID=A0AAV3XKR0_9CYAN|nr:hypothetical protein MiSe_77210 [Microseira wollei NIES-4236]
MSGLVDSLKKTSTRFSSKMLGRTILLPSVLRTNYESQAADYSMVIRLLQDIENNGVVLVDDTNCIRASLLQDIPKWPPKFRKKAEVVLKSLKKKNRFVEVSLKEEVTATCKNKPCQKCIRIAKIYSPAAILASQDCIECAKAQLKAVSSVEVVDVAEYCLSDFFESHLKLSDRTLNKGEWKQDKFEQEILIPLFRDAKHIKIYDRWIGRSVSNQRNPGQISDNYKLTIEWIIDVFLQKSRWGVDGIFEVYSGLDTRNNKANVPTFVTELRKFECDIKQSLPNFKLTIKEETKTNQMPHERYLITNQVAVSIDRGFDLLLDNRKIPHPRRVRDVTVAYCSEPGKIEQAVRSMPDL